MNGPAFNLAPEYKADEFVVPDSWRGSGPFVEAKPNDAVLRKDWWKLFNDPVLDKLEEDALAGNPDLQAAAERFVQARDEMMKARSEFLPRVGMGFDATDAKQSRHTLFRAPNSPIFDHSISLGGMAAWEPDFWSSLRNRARVEMYRAEERAADWANARLSITAELASAYFELRGLDARDAIYRQSIEYYQRSLDIVTTQFKGAIASEVDVARAQYLLSNTQAARYGVQGQRQVVEHSIAALVNMVPAAFTIVPLQTFEVPHFQVPAVVPSRLVERRPDVAAMEREMAQANRTIGIARAAFFPSIDLSGRAGWEVPGGGLFKLFNAFWSYGASVQVPMFQGGYLRAQLQQSWAAYRETEDKYRSTVLNAFREVEDGLSLSALISLQLEQQAMAVAAATKTQDLSMELFRGGLASSLELIQSQVYTLEARIAEAEIKAQLLRSVVRLIRSLGGGFQARELPSDSQIQPFGLFQARGLSKPKPAGGIDVQAENHQVDNDLTRPVLPQPAGAQGSAGNHVPPSTPGQTTYAPPPGYAPPASSYKPPEPPPAVTPAGTP